MRNLVTAYSMRGFLAAAAVASLVSCKNLDVPNYTSASIELLVNNPTPTVINQSTTGLLIGARTDQGGVVEGLDVYARNAYNLDPSEVRNVTIPLIGPLDPTQGPASWAGPYSNMVNAYFILHALDKVGSAMTDPQKEGIRGVAKALIAWELHLILRQTDTFGEVVDVDRPRSGNPDSLGAFVSKAAAFAQIRTLLDQADTHLSNAGGTFSFSISSGFQAPKGTAKFDTPATFRQFAKALRARVDVDMEDYAAALTDIAAATAGGTFSSVPATLSQLDNGVYHIYSTLAGDALNPLYDPTGRAHLAHHSLKTDVQLKGGGQPDDRFTRKIVLNTDANGKTVVRTLQAVSDSFRFTIYSNTSTDPIPWIRNEELILLRAEANLNCTGVAPTPNCSGNRAAALADINLIRTLSGGLPSLPVEPLPVAAPNSTGDGLLDELLYNKRYSLVYENGTRWVDLRRYGMLGTLPRQQSIHVTFQQRPIPSAECSARPLGSVAGCVTVQGLTTGPVVP